MSNDARNPAADESDSRKLRQRRVNRRTFMAGSAILLITPLMIGGITRPAILLSLSIVTGGLLWKIPPFEIPYQNKFWDLTRERFWELVLFAAKIAGSLILLAVIISPFYALLAHHKFIDAFLTYTAIGAALGTALGCLGWVVSRVLDDVEILRAEKERVDHPPSPARKPPETAANIRGKLVSTAAREELQEHSGGKANRTARSARDRGTEAPRQQKRHQPKRTRRKRRHR
jgi:hypothetical protein